MHLIKLHINNLFGHFNHKITFNKNEYFPIGYNLSKKDNVILNIKNILFFILKFT